MSDLNDYLIIQENKSTGEKDVYFSTKYVNELKNCIKQLEEVKRTFVNFLGRLIDGEKFTQEKLNEYMNIILAQKALEEK